MINRLKVSVQVNEKKSKNCGTGCWRWKRRRKMIEKKGEKEGRKKGEGGMEEEWKRINVRVKWKKGTGRRSVEEEAEIAME